MGREDMAVRHERRHLQTGTIDGFKLWSTYEQNNPNLLKQMKDNDTIDLQVFATTKFSIEAMYTGDVKKVHFFFDNQYYRTENYEPFFLAGDGGDYDYIYTGWPINIVGQHQIKAIPISQYGNAGAPVEINFEVIDGASSSGGGPSSPGVIGLKLWNTMSQSSPQAVKELSNGDMIDLHLYGNKLAIEAEVTSEVATIDWEIGGSFYKQDASAPFFTDGDDGSYGSVGTTTAFGSVGSHTVKARAYDSNGGGLTDLQITFTVVNTFSYGSSSSSDDNPWTSNPTPNPTPTPPVPTTPAPTPNPTTDAPSPSPTPYPTGSADITGFKLWDTTDQAHPQFIKLLTDNEEIDFQQYGTHFSIEAEVVGDIQKIHFGVDGVLHYSEEYQAPFLLDGAFDYQFLATSSVLSEIGIHTITATAFNSAGNEVTTESITISTIDTAIIPPVSNDPPEVVPDGYLTGFRLWNTTVPENPKFITKIEQADVIDIQYRGNQLTIEAEHSGSFSKIEFGLDSNDNYYTDTSAPFLLNGNDGDKFHVTSELASVGTHNVTATPYDLSGNALTPMTFSFLTVDGSTNAGSMSTPDARTELINLLEDDLSFYLSGAINAKYFFKSGHCLQWNLAFVKVDLVEVSDPMCVAPVRRLLPKFTSDNEESRGLLRHGRSEGDTN